MRIIYIISLLVFFYSCFNSKVENWNKFDSTNLKSKITINTKLPFGCDILITHKFPKTWETGNFENDDTIMRSHGKEFAEVFSFYERLVYGKTFIPPPILKVEHLKIGNENECICFVSLTLDSFRYKLPDFGKYECYYVSESIYENSSFIKHCAGTACSHYGKLVLYDKILKEAKVLTIYFIGGGDQYITYRFFYINKNKSIELFEGSGYDDSASLYNKYSITILENGEINIKENM